MTTLYDMLDAYGKVLRRQHRKALTENVLIPMALARTLQLALDLAIEVAEAEINDDELSGLKDCAVQLDDIIRECEE